jgi:2-isopropylmalate synthase
MTTESTAAQPKARVIIFDTTLRDGEQCPGATMTFEEKLAVAALLDEMGVDVIEAGYPGRSKRRLRGSGRDRKRRPSGRSSRASPARRRTTSTAPPPREGAERPRASHFVSTSPVHMKYKLQKSPEEVLSDVDRAVDARRNLVDDVEWSARTAPARRIDFLCRCVEAGHQGWRHHDQHPDTSATRHRTSTGALFRTVRERVPNSDKAVFSVHCHNDLGMAVANSLAGVEGRGAADRMHYQRHRRAGRQRGARGDRDGDAGCGGTCFPTTPGSRRPC